MFSAHARLMFRNEVTRLDAITAILCIESSMTTSAIVDSAGNALHSNFSENPDQECILLTEFAHIITFLSSYQLTLPKSEALDPQFVILLHLPPDEAYV